MYEKYTAKYVTSPGRKSPQKRDKLRIPKLTGTKKLTPLILLNLKELLKLSKNFFQGK
jgi:hypothetical protein